MGEDAEGGVGFQSEGFYVFVFLVFSFEGGDKIASNRMEEK